MWNLSEEDIKRAKEELKGRRAAIQARYENELKQLEADIADLDRFEHFAVKFVSDFKGPDEPAAAAEPVASRDDVVAEIVAQVAGGETAAVVAEGGESEPAEAADAITVAKAETAAESGSGHRGSSRWRMRLNTGEVASS